MPLAPSSVGIELLDDPAADAGQVRRSLENIARANRWFGGRAAVTWALDRALARVAPDTSLTLLDVGAGAGDLADAATRRARTRGVALGVLAVERHPAAAALLRERGWRTCLADAGMLPLGNRSVDLVLVSQLAHHFDAPSTVALLAECRRVARRGVLVADLRRSALAAAGFRAASRALGFDAATRADGLTSIRRAYDVAALEALLARAGMATAVHRRPGWRLVALWEAP